MKLNRLVSYLSHRPKLYAFIVGVGIVLFWRGIWHTADQIHEYLSYGGVFSSMDTFSSPWWDGPFSLLVGVLILNLTSSFISSFIGNELILSGLRGEKRLNEKTEEEVKNEESAIADIKDSLRVINQTLEQLERKVLEHHKK